MKQQLQQLLTQALQALIDEGILQSAPSEIRLDHSKDKAQGDFASNIAMVLSKQAKCAPKILAEKIVDKLADASEINKIEIAGPGFINFFMSQGSNNQVLEDILARGDKFGLSDIGQDQRVLLEFVSANPTGPLHVGHGRGRCCLWCDGVKSFACGRI